MWYQNQSVRRVSLSYLQNLVSKKDFATLANWSLWQDGAQVVVTCPSFQTDAKTTRLTEALQLANLQKKCGEGCLLYTIIKSCPVAVAKNMQDFNAGIFGLHNFVLTLMTERLTITSYRGPTARCHFPRRSSSSAGVSSAPVKMIKIHRQSFSK